MTDLVLDTLLEFLQWWVIFTVGYAVLIFTADWLLETWDNCRGTRQAERERLEEINADMKASVRHLSHQFAAAQRDIRIATGRTLDRH
ncbi:hypothetical protein O6072_18310 [Mycolicibacterium neoaurum]|uniref:hypothetical protein n=1 Tax=Mycolicibacterium neoaurum TaxID=1795 RepID=UPI00248CA228|nr:hypothetical protein [Mycolicibacterium neoaurum]WBP93225.1 hypothetical protein O7W24_18935 [Mycolicibacterium neoaurum]WBS06808.1 hypothetical protein O6072_18310 [Mycolicibacterium neoaurum]